MGADAVKGPELRLELQQEQETAEEKIARLEMTIRAIGACTLTGVDFGDWVQSVCEDALSGLWPECWSCGTAVHEGPCVEAAE